MDLYYQNETLYIDLLHDINGENYKDVQSRIFRIIDDYGVQRIVIQNYHRVFYNRYYLNQMKHDYHLQYHGDFLIK